jgi:hypothetical protein
MKRCSFFWICGENKDVHDFRLRYRKIQVARIARREAILAALDGSFGCICRTD